MTTGSDKRPKEGVSGDALPYSAEQLVDSYPYAVTTESDRIAIRTLDARAADIVPAADVLRPELARRWPFDGLYSHQADALDALAGGDNVAVATSTSSGKTAIYGLQIARNLLDAGVLTEDGNRARETNDASTALCLYPMKALTKDQQQNLNELYDELGLDITVAVYDGDTEMGETRRRIRERADVVLSNFQAISVYLGSHEKWSRFFGALDLVAIDESHTHTGVQGMHVAWILRRLERVVDYWGGDPQYTLTSATIGNPGEHSAQLVGEGVNVVDEDGSPRGVRELLLWNPPPRSQADAADGRADDAEDLPAELVPDRDGKGDAEGDASDEESDHGVADRVPASVEAPHLFAHLTAAEVETLLFCPSRKLTEVAVRRAGDWYADNRPAYEQLGWRRPSVEAYNAGHGKLTRQQRETEFKSGGLTGLASTSALELGIDIGSLDATVLLGYPGQRQSFWQRIGRAGRGGSESLSIMVADHRTLDQYVHRNPEFLLEADIENAVVDTENDVVFSDHLLAAAAELAVTDDDAGSFVDSERLEKAVEMFRRAGYVDGYLETGVHYTGPPRPQSRISIYGTADDEFEIRLVDEHGDGELDVEPVAKERAYRDYHEGAVQLLDGEQYEVVAVDEDRPNPVIHVRPADTDYYTTAHGEVTVIDAESEESRDVNGFTLHFGTGTVLVHYASYDKRYLGNGKPAEQGLPTGNPPITMQTRLCWVEVPDELETTLVRKYSEYGLETGVDPEAAQIPQLGYIAGLHAAEHAMIKTAPLELMLDKNDVGGLSTLVLDTHYLQPELESVDVDGLSLEAAQHRLETRTQRLDEGVSSGWFIYDGIEGGVGFSKAIYDRFESLAARARDSLRDCSCGQPNGCPACTFDENCGNDNKPLLRASAVDVFDLLLSEKKPSEFEEYLPDEEYGGHRRPAIFYS